MSDVVLELVDLKRSFTQGDVTIHVLRGVDAALKRGEIVALLGPSGSGKSTMLQAVGLLEGGFEGTIRIDGEDVTRFDQGARTKTRREKIGFVYQFHHLLPDFSAVENVVLPQLIRGARQAEAEERAADLLGAHGQSRRSDGGPRVRPVRQAGPRSWFGRIGRDAQRTAGGAHGSRVALARRTDRGVGFYPARLREGQRDLVRYSRT